MPKWQRKQLNERMPNQDTLYVWDLADTLFQEVWDKEKTGFPTYINWLEKRLGKDASQITPREYEENYRIPYRTGWYFNLDLKPGCKEVLSWAKNNEVFTTGVPGQFKWRAYYLKKKYGFDLKKYFKKINSTFDYGETNVKDLAMFKSYLEEKYRAGYRTIVYSDDKLRNLKFFKEAVDKNKKYLPNLSLHLYHVLNNNQGIKIKKWYWAVGTLLDLLENEKKLKKNLL